MSKKMTEHTFFKCEEVIEIEELKRYQIIVSTGLKEETKNYDVYITKAFEEETWEVKMVETMTKLQYKFFFGYAMLSFIEKMDLRFFTFQCKKIKTEFRTSEQIQTAIEDAWYENNEYYRYLREEKKIDEFVEDELQGNTEETKKSYKYSLRALYKYLFFYERDTFPKFNIDHLNRFIKHLEKEKKSATYINRTFVAIRKYASYKNKVIDPNKLRVPEVVEPDNEEALDDKVLQRINETLHTRFLQSKEDHAFKSLPNTGKQRDMFRDWIVFRVMLSCGLRLGEALNLEVDDVYVDGARIESRYVHVRKTKTNREKKVPLDKETAALLKEYIEFRKKNDLKIAKEKEYFNQLQGRSDINCRDGMTKKEEKEFDRLIEQREELRKDGEKHGIDYSDAINNINAIIGTMANEAIYKVIEKTFEFNPVLFVSNRYKKVSKVTMSRVFKEFGVRSHQFRHTAIKNLMDNNVPLNKIKEFSGHKSADMVLRYAKPTFKEVAEEITKHKKL
ncbi:tyrosine-type recombinase/integrase [Bacillus anthracis]|uniref:tyrosine-type recombinase/integrase n=1 Tax=Bacillus anthracis TaxID=1392 RepID=UPI00069D166F|nr:site-specific integrase [Bacillus anthracis]